MSAFDVGWLDRREPYDAAARAVDLEHALVGRIGDGPIVDLGAGTGANLRHLAPRLAASHDWILIDNDRRLLEAARARLGAEPAVTIRRLDLVRELHAVDLARAALVSAAALLDLVSEAWLEALVGRCADARVPALLVLSYDGRIEWSEPEDTDAEIVGLVNAHQRGDKGFGPALGPAAAAMAAERFADRGYAVRTGASDWVLAPRDGALQGALLRGWVEAALEIAPERAAAISRWRERRLRRIAAGSSRVRVGHLDLLALPP